MIKKIKVKNVMHSWLTQLPAISIYYFHPSHPFPFFNILKDCADQSNGLRLVSLSPFIYLFFLPAVVFIRLTLPPTFPMNFFEIPDETAPVISMMSGR